MEKERSATIKVKKSQAQDFSNEYEIVTCKIVDAYINEYMPKDTAEYESRVVLQLRDVKEPIIYTMNLMANDLQKIGISASDTKSMVDICAWLRSYYGTVTVQVPVGSRDITIDMLLHSDEIDEELEAVEEVDLLDTPVVKTASKTVSAKKKFGKK